MIGNVEYARLAKDYRVTIAGDTPESRLLAAIPWYLGWHSDTAPLLQCLKHEVDRFADVPSPPMFSLIAALCGSPPEWLDDLIVSLRLQSWLRWELILVDAGGALPDQLVLAREWTSKDSRVRLLTPPGTMSMAAARDAAVEMAHGEFLAFVEDSALLHPCPWESSAAAWPLTAAST